MLNKVILIGRITNNLQLKISKNGKEFLYFTLAVNNSFNNQADFIPCIAWEKTAKAMSNNIFKGSLIAVDGRLQVRQVKEENKEYAQLLVEVYAASVKFLESKTKKDKMTTNTNTSLMNNYLPEQNNNIEENFNIDNMTFNFNESNSNNNLENLNNEKDLSLLNNDDGIAWTGE